MTVALGKRRVSVQLRNAVDLRTRPSVMMYATCFRPVVAPVVMHWRKLSMPIQHRRQA